MQTSIDGFLVKEPKFYDLITALFVAVLLISEVAATKIVQLGFLQITGAVILFPISYIFSDILTEVYGYARARRVIWIGFMAVVLQAIVFMVVQYLPAASSWPNQSAYEEILGFVPRISLASIIAYWAGGFANDFTLAKMKIFTKGRYLWIRTVGSTVLGQAVDSFLFIGIAFYGLLPNGVVIQIALVQYLFKTAYEVVATPLTYFVIEKMKKAEGLDTYDTNTNFSPFHFEVKKI